MRKSYKKIILIELIIFLLAIINSFVSNILSGYNLILFLIGLMVLFKFLVGFEKDRNRLTKDVIYEMLISLMLYYLLYYIAGIFIGFVKTQNYYSLYGITKFLIPTTLAIILSEIFRFKILKKSEESIPLIILTTLSFIALDTTVGFNYSLINTKYDAFMIFAMTLLPAISTNIACTYIALNSSYKPNILMRLSLTLIPMLLPIVPNPDPYLKALIEFIIPALIGIEVFKFIDKYKDKEIDRNYRKKAISLMFVPLILTTILVYFVSGYFRYYAIAVASGSMNPVIKKGDVVIVDQRVQYKNIEKGDIIAFKNNGVIIVHRIQKIIYDQNEKKYYFYTKGDANTFADNYKIPESDIVGVVKSKIDKIGYPTVWLNEL